MNKKELRIAVFNKYGGRCAYCGCELQDKWHRDHLIPIRRDYKGSNCKHPEHDTFENSMPACASCNINKHSMSLEEFRRLITGFSKHLNDVSTQFKISLRYGLVANIERPVVFYFEQLNNI